MLHKEEKKDHTSTFIVSIKNSAGGASNNLCTVINPNQNTAATKDLKNASKDKLYCCSVNNNSNKIRNFQLNSDILFSRDDGGCALELSSTINTVLPTQRRTIPHMARQSRHFSFQKNEVIEIAKSDSLSFKDYMRCTSAKLTTAPSSASCVMLNSNSINWISNSSTVATASQLNSETLVDNTEEKKNNPNSSCNELQKQRLTNFKNFAHNQHSEFSVSSSVDSMKEEKIVSNFERSENSTILVLPKSVKSMSRRSSLTMVSQRYHPPCGKANKLEDQVELSSSPHDNENCINLSSILSITSQKMSPTDDSSSSIEFCTDDRNWYSTPELNVDIDEENSSKSDYNYNNGIERPQYPIWRKCQYLGELVWQTTKPNFVDELVFCGGIEAAQNQNLLCRLNIEYIVDLSRQDDDPELKNRPRNECPCLCSKRMSHTRMIMAINVPDYSIKNNSNQKFGHSSLNPHPATFSMVIDSKRSEKEREQIVQSFQSFIGFISKARISHKRVLIHSLRGRNRAPAFVAAYLMHCNRYSRVQALSKISKLMSKMRPGMCISDDLQRALMRWQSILCIRCEEAQFDSNLITQSFAVSRNAWS